MRNFRQSLNRFRSSVASSVNIPSTSSQDGETQASLTNAPSSPSNGTETPTNFPIVDLVALLDDLNEGRASYYPQELCILFKIPPEVRGAIFAYVVVERDGPTAIPKDDYWYRPDYTHKRLIDVALLRTCKMVWSETRLLPRQQIRRRHWVGSHDRAPECGSPKMIACKYFTNHDVDITYDASEESKAQLEAGADIRTRRILPCETLQVFIQMFALERREDLPQLITDAQSSTRIRHLVITLRYTDWWWWEDSAPLTLDSEWVRRLELPNSVEIVTIEFETRNGKKVELNNLLKKQASCWLFKTIEGKELRLSDEPPIQSIFVGTDSPGGNHFDHHSQEQNDTVDLAPREMLYYIVEMVWKLA